MLLAGVLAQNWPGRSGQHQLLGVWQAQLGGRVRQEIGGLLLAFLHQLDRLRTGGHRHDWIDAGDVGNVEVGTTEASATR